MVTSAKLQKNARLSSLLFINYTFYIRLPLFHLHSASTEQIPGDQPLLKATGMII
jgi:hypothetical protein